MKTATQSGWNCPVAGQYEPHGGANWTTYEKSYKWQKHFKGRV